MSRLATSIGLAFALGVGAGEQRSRGAGPAGRSTDHCLRCLDRPHVSRSRRDPGIGVPFVFLYALHDALIKPLPGNDMAPCLAESWKESADGLVYEFKLREGLKFHNGDPFTAEDVKFSFLRYRGASAKLLHDRVKAVDIVDPYRDPLRAPRALARLPRVLCHPGHRRGVDRAQEVHRDRSARRASGASRWGSGPIGSCAHDSRGGAWRWRPTSKYWRKKPSVKRVVIKSVPDRTTRLAMLQDRRGGHRLPDDRSRSDHDLRQTQAAPRQGDSAGHLVDGIHRAVEPQVAVERPPGPIGGKPGRGQTGTQRGRAAGVLTPDGPDHSRQHGVRAPHRAVSVRPEAGQAASRRGRLSQWLSTPAI